MNEKLRCFLTVKNFVRIIGVFIAGLLALVGIVLFMIPASQKEKCTEKVMATVAGFTTHDSDSGETYDPIFEYTYNGVEYMSSRFEGSNKYYAEQKFEIGQETEILIDPDEPTSIYSPEDDSVKNMILIFLGLWIGYIVVVVIIIPEIVFREKKG